VRVIASITTDYVTGTGMHTDINILKIIVTLTLLNIVAAESYDRKTLVRTFDHEALFFSYTRTVRNFS
jgi:hypothetical protein